MIVDITKTEHWDGITEVLVKRSNTLNTYGTPADKAVAYLREQLQGIGRKNFGWVMGFERHGHMEGIGALEASPWESSIYQMPMAKIPLLMAVGSYADQIEVYQELLGRVDMCARERGVRHLTCRVDTQETAQVHSLQNNGFLLMDTTIECLWTPAQLTPEPPPKWIIRPHQESDLIPLAQLARRAFTDRVKTRYGEDPYLPIERTRELYAQWFLESCRGAFAHVVLVAELDGKPVGFQTYKIEEEFARITGVALATFGIGTVSDEQRGKRVLPSMLRAVVRWGEARSVTLSRGRTVVHNISMHRACLRSGAFIGATFHTFHKWLG